jgi:spore photoproduct lyase
MTSAPEPPPCLSPSAWRPDRLLIEAGVEDTAVARRARASLAGIPVETVESRRGYLDATRRATPPATDAFGAGKRALLLHRERGRFLAACQAGTPGLVCCNYLTLSLVSNCPYDCSYCVLQDYLANNPTIQAATNVEDALAEVAAVLAAHPARRFRIGTGELADSLALEPLLGHAAMLCEFAAAHPNVVLELKTKSACVDWLGAAPTERVVISWSLTPPAIADHEEAGTASFGARLAAAARAQAAGCRVGIHFDPLVDYDGCEEDYRAAVAALAAAIDMGRVAWLSMGSLRTSAALRRIIRQRHPTSRVLLSEQVRTPDGKWRVFQARRVALYRRVGAWLREAAPQVPLYLCMEPPAVWARVFGEAPPGERELGRRLAAS